MWLAWQQAGGGWEPSILSTLPCCRPPLGRKNEAIQNPNTPPIGDHRQVPHWLSPTGPPWPSKTPTHPPLTVTDKFPIDCHRQVHPEPSHFFNVRFLWISLSLLRSFFNNPLFLKPFRGLSGEISNNLHFYKHFHIWYISTYIFTRKSFIKRFQYYVSYFVK